MKPLLACVMFAALLGGCSTNPVTGRGQIVDLPAAKAYADLGYVIASRTQRVAEAESCEPSCAALDRQFEAQVERLGVQLEIAARAMAPDLFERIASFDISVSPELGTATGSSAGGRIVLGGGIARLEPEDDVTAFLLAREMAHVIARHDEEDSGARIFFSAISNLLPVTLITRLFASTLSSGALMISWAEQQRREADEIALALLMRTGRSIAGVAGKLGAGYSKERMPQSEWAARFAESAGRVALAAAASPESANFDDRLMHADTQSIERITACIRSAVEGKRQAEILAWRRECLLRPT